MPHVLRPHLFFLLLAFALAACESAPPPPPELEEAASHLEANRAQAAYDLLKPFVEENPESAEALVLYADACRRLGRTRRAVRSIEKATELDPENARAWSLRGHLEYDRHRFAEAIEAYERAVELAPEELEYRLLLGSALNIASDLDGAVDALAAAYRLAPDEPRTSGEYGRALVAAGRHDEGLPYLETYLVAQPNDPTALYHRGLAHFRQKNFEAAESDFRQAIRADPSRPGPYHNLANILQMTGRADEAAGIRETHRVVSDRDAAIRGAKRRLVADPGDVETVRELVQLLTEAGRVSEAQEMRRRIPRTQP